MIKQRQQCSRCFVSSFWARSPNMVVTWHDPTLRIAKCGRRCPNTPDFYRTHRHLAWEIQIILNARFATQNSTGHGITTTLQNAQESLEYIYRTKTQRRPRRVLLIWGSMQLSSTQNNWVLFLQHDHLRIPVTTQSLFKRWVPHNDEWLGSQSEIVNKLHSCVS